MNISIHREILSIRQGFFRALTGFLILVSGSVLAQEEEASRERQRFNHQFETSVSRTYSAETKLEAFRLLNRRRHSFYAKGSMTISSNNSGIYGIGTGYRFDIVRFGKPEKGLLSTVFLYTELGMIRNRYYVSAVNRYWQRQLIAGPGIRLRVIDHVYFTLQYGVGLNSFKLPEHIRTTEPESHYRIGLGFKFLRR